MSKEFALENFKVKIVANSDTLSIKRMDLPSSSVRSVKGSPDLPKADEDPLIFFKKDDESFLFWNDSTKNFVRDRPRPKSNIGEWNLQRILATSFLEKLMRVNASKLQDSKFIAAFNDPGWEDICKHIAL